MKSDLQARPQSKQIISNAQPTSRHINQEQAQQYFRKGKIQQTQNNFQQAMELYIRAIAYDNNYYQAYCNMGSCLRALGRYAQAKNQYKRSISIKPDDSISHYNLANIERIIGNYQQSIESYNYVIKLKQQKDINIGSLYLYSLINIGICYNNIGQIDKAISYYEKANLIDLNDEGSIFNHAMCVMLALNKNDIDNFHELSKVRIKKASGLLKRTIQINPNNQMARLCLIELTYVLNREQQNIILALESLKKLQNEPNCNIKDEINEQIGICLKIIKDYENSDKFYQSSLQDINKRKQSQQNMSSNLNKYDVLTPNQKNQQSKPILVIQRQILKSEEQGLAYIEINKFQASLNKISEIDDNTLFKHTLQLIIYLKQVQIDKRYNENAIKIYNKWFFKNSKQIPFDEVSLEGHKAIGKVLSLQGLYKDAITHFKHVSNLIKSPRQVASIHSAMAQGYEAMGLKQKALQQCQAALKLDPENYCFVYNVGCCLNQNGQQEQSLKYFQKFLILIQKENLDYKTKDLYITDCYVTMALCSKQNNNEYQLFQKAFDKLSQLKQNQNQKQTKFESDILLNFYLRFADLLETKINNINDKKLSNYKRLKQKLLQTYSTLLQFSNCPDHDPIAINCGNMYYDEKLYLNAVDSYKAVKGVQNLLYSNISLAYLHLYEHDMAIKYIYLALEQEEDNPLVKFNFSVMSWIYGLSTEGKIYQKFPNSSENMLLYRLQYGLLLIDKLTLQLNNKPDQDPQKIITILLDNDLAFSLENQGENIKFKAILNKLRKSLSNNETSNQSQINQDIIRLSFNKSIRIDDDFKQLINLLKLIPKNDKQISILQSIICMFIYNNRQNQQAIKKIMKQESKIKQNNIVINLDKITVIPEHLCETEYDSGNINELIQLFKDWQCALQSKLVSLIKCIQNTYYKYEYRAPLQIQYHFPRHNNYKECDVTLNRLINIIYKIIKIDLKPTAMGTTIKNMKQNLIKQIEKHYEQRTRQQPFGKISLNDQFLPATIFTFHKNKQSCLSFIEDLQKNSRHKHKISVDTDCQELIIIVNKVLRMKCQWQDENYLKNLLKSFAQNSLGIFEQSIISLESQIGVLKQESSLGKNLLQELPAFKF